MILQIYISQGNIATQLRCGGTFSNFFITKFPLNLPMKKILQIGQYLSNVWTKVCGLFFGPPCRHTLLVVLSRHCKCN